MTKQKFSLLVLLSFWLFVLIGEEHRLMEYRLQIPKKEKELAALEEEKKQLEITIDSTFSLQRLLELLRDPRFSHLGFPQNPQ